MVFFANSNDIIVVDIEVTEKIDDRYLKSFVLSNLKLKNISLENCDKLYVNYLEYPKEYQVFVVNSQFIFFDFEAFYSYYENRDFEGFELLIYSNFFLIFKDKKFFYYQKINQDLNQDDFIKFLNKKFNINISNIKVVSKDEFEKLKKDFIQKNQKINPVSSAIPIKEFGGINLFPCFHLINASTPIILDSLFFVIICF